MKKILFISVLFLATFASTFIGFAQENSQFAQLEEEILNFSSPEVMPSFPGGINALVNFLSENIVYPAEAIENNEQGRVVLQFWIETDGKINDIEVIRGVSPAIDAEAIRLIELMPNWNPAENRGKKIRYKFTLPINFRLDDGETAQPRQGRTRRNR